MAPCLRRARRHDAARPRAVTPAGQTTGYRVIDLETGDAGADAEARIPADAVDVRAAGGALAWGAPLRNRARAGGSLPVAITVVAGGFLAVTLTEADETAYAPALSPDGRRIAWVTVNGDRTDLVVATGRRRGARRSRTPPAWASRPAGGRRRPHGRELSRPFVTCAP
ncbi:MAG: hypothetical protein U0531_01215 [Dehalococcoidia bacterium]